MVGSAARMDHPADVWSDYDVIVLASDPQLYFSSPTWLATLGSPWFHFIERTPAGDPLELRVLFEGGYDIDFILVSLENARQDFRDLPMLPEIMQRGMRVLLDKDGLLSSLAILPKPAQTVQPPSSQTFLGVVNDFWFHVAWTAKKLRRGEIWVAKSCCDVYLKSLLLRMVEWETRSVRGWDFDTWFNGRFIEEWALSETLVELRQVFATFDTEDIWRALRTTEKTFARIALKLASHLGYAYPADTADQVSQWVSLLHP